MATSMTSENKLSIVIAFGLLIFVGMLVADHFSIASHREVAQLGSNAPSPPLLHTSKLIDVPSAIESSPPTTNVSGDRIHIVQQGETLRSICSEFYGDSGLANAVAKWNNIANPDNIEKGVRIAIPARTSLIAGSLLLPKPMSQPILEETPLSTAPRMATYTVQKGDTLSEIAQKIMGSTKFTQILIDNNTDVMPNPNKIRSGMTLRYPVTN